MRKGICLVLNHQIVWRKSSECLHSTCWVVCMDPLSPNMQVFGSYLTFSWHRMSDSQATRLELQRWWRSNDGTREPVNHALGLTLHQRTSYRSTINFEPPLPRYSHAFSKSAKNPESPQDTWLTQNGAEWLQRKEIQWNQQFPVPCKYGRVGLIRIADKPTSSHHISTVWRALCMHDLQHCVWEFLHCQQTNVIGLILSICATFVELCYQIIKAPLEWWQHTTLWATPGCCNLQRWIIDSHHG